MTSNPIQSCASSRKAAYNFIFLQTLGFFTYLFTPVGMVQSSNPPCPSGSDTNYLICPHYDHVNNLLSPLGIPNIGVWEPALQNSPVYNSCVDGTSVFIYQHDYPGCPSVEDTARFQLLWSPCNWQLENVCYTEDSTFFTIPAFPGDHEASTYSFAWYFPGETFYLDSTYDLSIPISPCYDLQIYLEESPYCWWPFGELLAWDFYGTCTDVPCSGSNPPCPTGNDTTFAICPWQSYTNDLLESFQLPTDGIWEPPLHSPSEGYNSCFDNTSIYIYTLSSPECPDVQDTVHFSLLWEPPCNTYEACFTADSFIITLPPFPEFSGNSYVATIYVATEEDWEGCGEWTLNPDIEHVISCVPGWDNFDFDIHCVDVFITDPITSCSWLMGVYNAENWLCGFPPCGCTNPPYAGQDNSINICVDADPFDLTSLLGNNPDPGGIWTPLLDSGGNIYDPEVDGSGTFIYVVDGGPDCSDDQASVSVTVVPFIIPEISGVPNSICENEAPINLPIVQDGITGNWSGIGTSNNTFNPSDLNGSITLTFIPNPGQCGVPAIIEIVVESEINVMISGVPDTLCQLDAPIPLLTNQSGVIGNWSGQGVTSNTFNPADLNGDIILTFTPVASQCADAVAVSVFVEIAIIPLITGIPDSLCQLQPPIILPAAPGGIIGNWAGLGVSANSFNPSGLNGMIVLTFTPEASQCAMIANASIFVEPVVIPVITGVADVLCQNDLPITLPSIHSNITGTWLGPGVSSNEFNPADLNGIITLTFTPLADQCASITYHDITVNTPITPILSGIPDSICETSQTIPLPTIQGGITGNWSGIGVDLNSFDPEGSDGLIFLTFTPDPGQCAMEAMSIINVYTPFQPAISGIPSSICETAGAIALPAIQNGIPGNWSGPGVSSNSFNPVGLNGMFNLLFSPLSDQCAEPTSFTIVVDPSVTPLITGIPGSFCEMDTIVLLPEMISNISGTWSGQGISNDTFNPYGLNGILQLSFNPDAGQCADTVSTQIEVHSKPSFTNLSAICDSSAASYVVNFEITGGIPGSYNVNGIPVAGSLFTSLPIGADTMTFTFILDDDNGCGPVTINGSINCACATSAGTMDFSLSPIKICDGDDFMVVHHQDQNLDPDDLIQYVLHDQAGTQLGTIYAISNFTLFGFPTGISFGQVYYVSAIAGSNTGNGMIDLADPCLSVSQGVPVIFYQPSYASISLNLCSGDSLLINGSIYNETNPVGVENYVGGNIHGCDSLLTVNLSFYTPVVHNIQQTLCYGGSLIIDGIVFNEENPSGSVILENASYFNCDSIIQINLTFDSVATALIRPTLCSGDSLDINGTIYDELNPSGSQLIPEGSYLGCDSILQVELLFTPFSTSQLHETLCIGESITLNGVVYNENHTSGTIIIPNGNMFGCDSIIEVMISLAPEAKEIITDTLKSGESIYINGVIYDILHPIGTEIILNGSYYGCDSIIEISLYYYSAIAATTRVASPACYGDATGQIILESVTGGIAPYSISLNDLPAIPVDTLPFVLNGIFSGEYKVTIIDASSGITNLYLTIPQGNILVVDAGEDQKIKDGHDTQLTASSSGKIISWTWSPPDFLTCTNCPDPNITQLNSDVIYTILVTDINECTASDEVSVFVITDGHVYFPNVFSPNGDALNDVAFFQADASIKQIIALSIFSRWGECVFQQNNFYPNDPQYGWDGTIKGEKQNPGVFAWIATIEIAPGILKNFSGDLTLIR